MIRGDRSPSWMRAYRSWLRGRLVVGRVRCGLLRRAERAHRDGEVVLKRATQEILVLTRAGVLVERLQLRSEIGLELGVERDTTCHLAKALDALGESVRKLLDGIALDDVRSRLRVLRQRESAAPVLLHALVVNKEAQAAGPVTEVRVPVLMRHRAILIVSLLVDEPLTGLVDHEERVAIVEPDAVVGSGAGDGLLEDTLVTKHVVQVAERGRDATQVLDLNRGDGGRPGRQSLYGADGS